VLWRLWSFLSGLPLGVMLALAVGGDSQGAARWIAWGAAGGVLTLGLVALVLARMRDDEPERGRHVAHGAASAWLALPAAVLLWLGLAPDPLVVAGLVTAVVVLALAAAARAIGPAGGVGRWLLRATACIVIGAPLLLAIAAASAALRGAGPSAPTPRFSTAVYDMDAAVATRPLPVCGPRPRAVRVLLDRGAHPSLSPDGSVVWFDAAVPEEGGRRQIHRLTRAENTVECWTCGEPGNNVRPAAGDTGVSLVFETDRTRSWLHPDDTDVHLLGARHPGSSRRLTLSHGPDSHPLLAPGSRIVSWSRRERGRWQVVAASMQSGHGGLLLGATGVLASGGAAWLAPLAWSPDGRVLVVGRGNPFAPLTGLAIDPATGAATPLGDDLAGASFVADGGWLAIATTHAGHPSGALPDFLGFALGSWADAVSRRETFWLGSGVKSGPAANPSAASPIDLPEDVERWGAPTGLALEPDGGGLVLGQRRAPSEGGDERLLEIAFECESSTAASGQGIGQ
jgi:hypothetical protein